MTVRSAVVVVILMCAIGCTVPGSPYSYLDVRVAGTLATVPAWPATTQGVEFRQAIRSTYNKPLNLAYEIRDDTDADPLTYTIIRAGTLTIGAFEERVISEAWGTQPAGIHIYTMVLDPANVLGERYESNNAASLVVGIADLDIVFASPAPVIATPVPALGDITLDFVIGNTTNPAAGAQPSNVSYVVTIDGDITVSPITTASVASPVAVVGGTTQAVTVTLPNPGTGHTLTITLTSSVQERSVTNNVVTVVVPAPG